MGLKKFEPKETGFHRQAINVLCDWIKNDPVTFHTTKNSEIQTEVEFKDSSGKIIFVPDIVVYIGFKELIIFEVYYKSVLTGQKLMNMMDYFYAKSIKVECYEISALDILRQIKPPKSMKTIDCIKMI